MDEKKHKLYLNTNDMVLQDGEPPTYNRLYAIVEINDKDQVAVAKAYSKPKGQFRIKLSNGISFVANDVYVKDKEGKEISLATLESIDYRKRNNENFKSRSRQTEDITDDDDKRIKKHVLKNKENKNKMNEFRNR